MLSYLAYFSLNYVLELVVARLCLPGCGLRRVATVVLFLNLVTHPLLWFVVSRAYTDYWRKLLVGEVLVFAVEVFLGVLLLRKDVAAKGRIVFAVVAANSLSFACTFIF